MPKTVTDSTCKKVTTIKKSQVTNCQMDRCTVLTCGPPVPKRSPSTCLSTTSVNGESMSTPPGLSEKPFDPCDTSVKNSEHLNRKKNLEKLERSESSAGEKVERTIKKNRKLGKKLLSRKPIQKGAPRPRVKIPVVQEEEEPNNEFNYTTAEESQPTSRDCISEIQNSALSNNKADVILPKKERFAIIKQLLITKQLPGLDEPPPSFKPPPPPSAHQTNSCSEVNGKCSQKTSAAIHVTSVQISSDDPRNVTLPNIPNVSVITIHNENQSFTPNLHKENSHYTSKIIAQTEKKNIMNNSNAKDVKTITKVRTDNTPADISKLLPSKFNNRNKTYPLNSTSLPISQICEHSITHNVAKLSNVEFEPQVPLSTFNRDVTSSRSSSQEDLCAPSDPERRPLDKPDIKNTNGLVFFNVFQCDTMYENGAHNAPITQQVAKASEVETSKKKGWITRKSKKSKQQAKEKYEPKEITKNDHPELPGCLRRAPSPPRNKLPAEKAKYLESSKQASCMEDSDENASCSCDCALKFPG